MAVNELVCHSDGDRESDGDIDIDDFKAFANCVSGPGVVPPDAHCECFDFDLDTDVDLVDFGIFQRVFTGPQSVAASHLARPRPPAIPAVGRREGQLFINNKVNNGD